MSQRNSKKACKYLVGIDEVGRGPIAGPVTIGAVLVEKKTARKILNILKRQGIKDSKKLSAKKREELFCEIKKLKKERKIEFNISSVSAKKIDDIGISKCIKKCIATSLSKFKKNPNDLDIKLDGSLYAPEKYIHQETIIKGDDIEPIISVASIVAKVLRDRRMDKYGTEFPKYGFEVHKGYGTLKHRNAIQKYGTCVLHRKSYCKNI